MCLDSLVDFFWISGANVSIDNVLHNYWPNMKTCVARWTSMIGTVSHCYVRWN